MIIHNYDRKDGKPNLYYTVIDKIIAKSKSNKHIKIVVVSEYWKDFFYNQFGLETMVFPNLFNVENYLKYSLNKKDEKLIHLGQFSEKIDKKNYLLLINELQKKGYAPYFSSNSEIATHFPIVYFETTEAYLQQMSNAYCTIIWNQINEGWNRVAHESFLVGTHVLCSAQPAMEFWIKKAGGKIFTGMDEILELIEKNNFNEINWEYVQSFNVAKAELFLNGE